MAYGQTGSGKTHTMVGGHTLHDDLESTETDYSMEGIIPRAAREIFRFVRTQFVLFSTKDCFPVARFLQVPTRAERFKYFR